MERNKKPGKSQSQGIKTENTAANSQNTYLKVSSKANRKKTQSGAKNRHLANKVPNIDGVPIKKEPIDIRLSCEYIFQYLFENKCINQRYFKLYAFFMYTTLVMINSTVLNFILFTREPNLAYQYECFNVSTHSYEKCTYRNWCGCEDRVDCVVICYNSKSDCMDEFTNKLTSTSSQSPIQSFYGKIYVRYIDALGKQLNVFEGINSNHCNVRYYTVLISLCFFVGGLLGCLLFGLLADKYGKKVVTLSQVLLLEVSLILICVFANFPFTWYTNDIASFLIIWCINGFFLGACLFSSEYLIYTQFMEKYPDINGIGKVNGFFHSHFSFSGVIIYIFNNWVKNLVILFYVISAYFVFFFIFFLIFFVENPRYFSERKDFINKKISFDKIMNKTLVHKKKENGEEEKFWKVIVFYDSSKQKIEGDEIKDKLIEVDDEELEYLYHSRNRGINGMNITNGGNLKSRKQLGDRDRAENKPRKTKKSLKDEILMLNANANSNGSDPGSWAKNLKKENESISGLSANTNVSNLNLRSNDNPKNISNSILNFNKEKMDKALGKDKKEKPEISIKEIYTKYQEDQYLNKYFYIFFLVWLSLSFCFYGMTLSLILDASNPNLLTVNIGALAYSSVMCFIMPIIFGNLSFYFSSNKLIFICMLIYSIISVTLDSYKISPDVEREIYFGRRDSEFSVTRSLHYNRATGTYFMFIAYSLFEKMTIISAPTLYRTYFLSICKGFSKLTAYLAYVSITRLDAPFLNIAIVSFFTCIIFLSVDVKWKELKLNEFNDSEGQDSGQKKDKRKMTLEVKNLDARKSRTSIFNRLRNYSLRKLRKQQ